ncbi:MAG: rRNA maturation RNase YbeY [Pseudomonadota bacterium]
MDAKHTIDIQWAISRRPDFPNNGKIRRWLTPAICALHDRPVEILVRIVATDEMAELNSTWRGKSGPTNVLSFPSNIEDEQGRYLLGDLVICADVVVAEAEAQRKDVAAHFCHMLVHGMLHLSGFDHVLEAQAEEMERLERQLLAELNFPDPYLVRPENEGNSNE